MKKNRIIVIADEGEVLWESLVLPEQQTEIYQAKNIQDALSHLTVFSYHLILIAVKQEPEIICQLVETIRKMVITPVIVLLPDHSEMRNKIIQAGADVVLTQLCTEEISLQAYALIRRYTEWKSERKEEVPVIVGKLEILPLQRTVEWEHKRIHVVKREFDFLYLLASTPGRVYTYSQSDLSAGMAGVPTWGYCKYYLLYGTSIETEIEKSRCKCRTYNHQCKRGWILFKRL